MLFSYLIPTIISMHGSISAFWTFSIDDHISIDHVITEGGRCNLVLGISLRDDEHAIRWDQFEVKDANGVPVQIKFSDFPTPAGVMLPGVSTTANPGQPRWGSRSVFIMDPEAPKFSFSVNIHSATEDGSGESTRTDVMCDASICACSGTGEPHTPFQTRYTY